MSKVLALILAIFSALNGAIAFADELNCLEARPIQQVIQPEREASFAIGPGVYTASASKTIAAEPLGSVDGAGAGVGAGGAGIPSGSATN